MFVLFDRVFQGYLSVSVLPRDRYELNELETMLCGERTGLTYKIADLVRIRVVAVDAARGRVDLVLAGDADEAEDDGDDGGRRPEKPHRPPRARSRK